MKKKVITITGGSGFVGQMLHRGLGARGYDIRVFDRFGGSIITLLRHPPLATARSPLALKIARRLKKRMTRLEESLIGTGILRPGSDDILGARERLRERFRGSDAVIHLAGLPHEHVNGATPSDFQRINYQGSINVYEAAREAGVPKFVFASSAQVYKINQPVRLEQFPILESNYCPTLEQGQSHYGWFKLQFERYLAERSGNSKTQSISLRLEMPGVRSHFPFNFYISTSIENLVAGFAAALETELDSGFDVFNLADAVIDRRIVDIQRFVGENWPQIPNRTAANECLLSTEKARSSLGYNPQPGGRYYDSSVIWG